MLGKSKLISTFAKQSYAFLQLSTISIFIILTFMVVNEYYDTLSRPQKALFREIVCRELGIMYATFASKVKKNRWTKAEEFYISEKIIKELKQCWLG